MIKKAYETGVINELEKISQGYNYDATQGVQPSHTARNIALGAGAAAGTVGLGLLARKPIARLAGRVGSFFKGKQPNIKAPTAGITNTPISPAAIPAAPVAASAVAPPMPSHHLGSPPISIPGLAQKQRAAIMLAQKSKSLQRSAIRRPR